MGIPKETARKALTIRVSPEDERKFKAMADAECRTYGELLCVLMFKAQQKQEGQRA